MSGAKLQLSAEQMLLVTDPGWILTKNSIISKVVALFAGLSQEWRAIWEGQGPAGEGPQLPRWELTRSEPKISKGENYKGLPYVMLDYPRVFGKADIFAIRTMFWWGHGFSMTLHLKGKYKALLITVIREHAAELAAAGFQPGRSADEWEHAYDPVVGEAEAETILTQRPFLKLSAVCGIAEADRLGQLFITLKSILCLVVLSES